MFHVVFLLRPGDPVNNWQHPLHHHPHGAEDEEEEDHHLVPAPGLGRLHGHYVCYSRYNIQYSIGILVIIIEALKCGGKWLLI